MELQQPTKTEQQTLTAKQRTPGIISHLIQAFKKRRLEAQTPVLSEKTLQDIGVTHAKILAGFIRP